jgi:sugar phosphate isomerase/epimerase
VVQVAGRMSILAIYVSTSCLKDGKDLFFVLDLYSKCGIQNIELGSNHDYVEGMEELLKRHSKKNFIVHNYFPPAKVPFMMNLAAQDERTRIKSVEVSKKAIDLCSRLGYPLYSFHPGFRVEKTLDSDFGLSSHIVPYEESFKRFLISLEEIAEYARKAKVSIALENLEHKHEAYMMTRPFEFKMFLETFPNMGVLVDLGHLKIASQKFGFCIEDFLGVVRYNIAAMHIHENDGRGDLHTEPTNSGLLRYLNYVNCDKIILECRGLSIDRIIRGLDTLENAVE